MQYYTRVLYVVILFSDIRRVYSMSAISSRIINTDVLRKMYSDHVFKGLSTVTEVFIVCAAQNTLIITPIINMDKLSFHVELTIQLSGGES